MTRDIWDGIRARPGRIALSFLAIAVGIAALTALMALLGGLEEKSRAIVQELGANVIGLLQNAANADGRGRPLRGLHARYLGANLPGCQISGVRRYGAPMPGNDQQLTILATDEHLQEVRQWEMAAGAFFDSTDVQERRRIAVISENLGRAQNWNIGNVILVGQTPFVIAGMIKAGGTAVESELAEPGLVVGERAVFVPGTVSPAWVSGGIKPDDRLDAIFIRVSGAGGFEETLSRARNLLGAPDYAVDGLSVVVPETLLANLRRLQRTIRLTVGSIAFLGLILGGSTMMSLMTADVRHRVTEIGLRRALGATRRDVAGLFVGEAIAVTVLAGLAGSTAMHVILRYAQGSVVLPLNPTLPGMVVPTMIAVCLGAAFSYWPARMAADMPPSEALRNE